MKRLSRLALLTSLGLAAVAFSAEARGEKPPRGFKLKNLSYSGSGCPAGSVAETISPDSQAFTLTFNKFAASVAPSQKEARRACLITAAVDVPRGWTFAVATVDFRGYVFLSNNVTATHSSRTWWQGLGKTTVAESIFKGPLDEDYVLRDDLKPRDLDWSECNTSRRLNVDAIVYIANNKNKIGEGEITVDSIDGALTQRYGLVWKKCN